MANQKIIIRGKTINGNTIKSFATSKAKAIEALGDWANAAAAHAVINGDAAWLNGLMKACQTASGNPSADSKRVVPYIKAHAAGLQYNKGVWTLSKKAERRQLTEVLEDGQTFKLTLAQFEALEKAEKPAPEAKPITGKQLAARMSGMLEALQNGVKVADTAEAGELAKQVSELYKALDKAISNGAAETVDVDKAAQLATIKPTSKERAAPKAKKSA